MSTTASHDSDSGIDYPGGDGKPMAETPWHLDAMIALIQALRSRYAENDKAYVSGNMMLYYERGNARRYVSPDVQVTLGIPKLPQRRVYKTWAEGKAPDVVIEVTSGVTREHDLGRKYTLYRRMGVREYLLFDPDGDYIDSWVAGFRLVGGRYKPIPLAEGRMRSDILGLEFVVSGPSVRLVDPANGATLTTSEVLDPPAGSTRGNEADYRAELARRRIEDEVERLKVEVAALRRKLSTIPD